MEYMLNQIVAVEKVIVIIHNRGRFDEQFILNSIITEIDITPELTMRK